MDAGWADGWVWMDGRMDGCGWMNGWMDGWMGCWLLVDADDGRSASSLGVPSSQLQLQTRMDDDAMASDENRIHLAHSIHQVHQVHQVPNLATPHASRHLPVHPLPSCSGPVSLSRLSTPLDCRTWTVRQSGRPRRLPGAPAVSSAFPFPSLESISGWDKAGQERCLGLPWIALDCLGGVSVPAGAARERCPSIHQWTTTHDPSSCGCGCGRAAPTCGTCTALRGSLTTWMMGHGLPSRLGSNPPPPRQRQPTHGPLSPSPTRCQSSCSRQPCRDSGAE